MNLLRLAPAGIPQLRSAVHAAQTPHTTPPPSHSPPTPLPITHSINMSKSRPSNVVASEGVTPSSMADWGPVFAPGSLDCSRFTSRLRSLTEYGGSLGCTLAELDAVRRLCELWCRGCIAVVAVGRSDTLWWPAILTQGRSYCPYHYHLSTDEAVYVLSGEGELRQGVDKAGNPVKCAVRAGDYIHWPAGSASHAHLLTATSSTLRYLAFSYTDTADVCVYPDSNKIMASGAAHGQSFKFPQWFPAELAVPYWAGEANPKNVAQGAAGTGAGDGAHLGAGASAGAGAGAGTSADAGDSAAPTSWTAPALPAPAPVAMGDDGRPDNVVNAENVATATMAKYGLDTRLSEHDCSAFHWDFKNLTGSLPYDKDAILGASIVTLPPVRELGLVTWHACVCTCSRLVSLAGAGQDRVPFPLPHGHGGSHLRAGRVWYAASRR